jgi:anaerobic selenocysteine-containing dehydrogenase
MRDRRLSAADHLWPKAMYTTPQRIIKSVLDGDPYSLHGAYIQGANVLLTYTNAKQALEAFKKLDFLVVADLFMTPTASIADIVFPVSSFLEYDGFMFPPYYKIASVHQKAHPEPVARIHPDTAKALNITNGDWIYIETTRGKIKQKCLISEDISPKVADVDYGWWYPEHEAAEMFGWDKANINILTNDAPPFNREMGSSVLRGILCKIYKAD